MGPDEYHDRYPNSETPGLNNNAYTNIMAVWVLCRALEVLEMLAGDGRRELRETLNITKDETVLWEDITHRDGRCHFTKDQSSANSTATVKLKELDWDRYRKKI